jgi:hypothetical protein
MKANLPCSFAGLTLRLLDELRHRIRNGELTERGLAKLTGISQPHIHNTLKGLRALSPRYFDLVLVRLGLTLLDLLPRKEIEEYLTRPSTKAQVRLHLVPGLSGSLGLGLRALIPGESSDHEARYLPYLTAAQCSTLAVHDPDRHEAHPIFAAGGL